MSVVIHSPVAHSPVEMDEGKCPLCGEPNGCRAAVISPCNSESCWCFETAVPESLKDRVPPALQGKACICLKCVQKALRTEDENPN